MKQDYVYFFLQRSFDIVFAILFIIVFSPIYIFSAIKIWSYDKHSPIYTQARVGRAKKEFKFYKFRSMVVNADEILFKDKELYEKMRSGNNKVEKDPRVTPYGRFIRKYSIDEFPQMLNVLLGDMSVIGPRALRPDEFALYENKSQENARKLEIMTSVRPGITGYWQVGGRSNIDFDTRMDMDCFYANKKSILFDVQIAFKTPYAMIKGEGAY